MRVWSLSKSTNFFKISHLWKGDVFLWTLPVTGGCNLLKDPLPSCTWTHKALHANLRMEPGDSPASQASLLGPELCVSIFVKMVIYCNSNQGPKILNSNSSLINYKSYVIFKTWTRYMVQSMQIKFGKSNVDELIIYLMCVKGGSSKEIFYKRSFL